MKIILATINARYSHCAFALRYLKANLKEFEKDTEILEYQLDSNLNDIAEEIIEKQPDYVGFSCYLWNIEQTLKICEIIKKIAPQIKIIFGGPEVSYEYEEFLPYCDYLIVDEGELALHEIIKNRPSEKIVERKICDLSQIKLPYYLYSDEDIKNRLIYVEASRGCPFTCEFCTSSLSKGVREFDLDLFLENMQMLLDKGVWQFKFIDRTFNINLPRLKKILDFFKPHNARLHFEIFPDKLSHEMLEEIKNYPAGKLHLEAGVQSFYEPSLSAISRKQNEKKTLENIKYILEQTGAEIHADLIAGLPHSTIKTFAEDFDKIMQTPPHELQIGILKKLRGTSIKRHDKEFAMVYSSHPPYEILQNKDMSYEDLQTIKRLARYFDIFYNSGKFKDKLTFNTFNEWLDFTNYIWNNYHQTYKISFGRQTEMLESYLNERKSSPLL